MNAARQTEIERNYSAFEGQVVELENEHKGRFALMRHETVVEIFDKLVEAVVAGHERYDDGMFSVQEVIKEPLDLGFFSHANPSRRVC